MLSSVFQVSSQALQVVPKVLRPETLRSHDLKLFSGSWADLELSQDRDWLFSALLRMSYPLDPEWQVVMSHD